ncbi:MAG: cellulose biosynthesis cyclic di-GMP-binding regulatory protein BcsB, partial [Chloroflexota bacterium]
NFEAFNDFRSDADDCPDQSGAWITVFDNSSFNVGYNTATVPDLHVFPYPFVSRETEENTAIILPDDFNSDDVQNAITMATVLGRYATLDHSLVVTSKSLAEADANLLTDNHLITIGLDQNDSLALAIFENLIDAQAQRNNAAYPASMYAITSPYNEEKQTLLITGDTPSAVGEIVQAFAENIPAVDQPTTSVVVDNNQEIINLNRIEFVPGEDTLRGTPDDIPDDAVVIIITATPQAEPTSIQDALATALVTPGNNIANNPVNDTTEAGDVEGGNTAPISSQLSFIIIIILAALVLPFAFALTRNNS